MEQKTIIDASVSQNEQFRLPYVAELTDVTITGEGMLFRDDSVLAESFAREENMRRWKRKRVRRRYEANVKLRPSVEIESAVWVTDDWSKGYFHWLADVLPRLVVAAGHLQTSRLLLPKLFRDSGLVSESLKLFGISNCGFVDESESVLAKRLYVPVHTGESGKFHSQTIGEVRRILTSGVKPTVPPSRRIYISRVRAKRRKIVNEAEISNTLRDFGFETVVAEELTFAQQIELFASAGHLVSIHGAGLANMLFMPHGGQILELRKNAADNPEHFANMSAALGHSFQTQTCPAVDESLPTYTADLIADPNILRRELSEFLNPN